MQSSSLSSHCFDVRVSSASSPYSSDTSNDHWLNTHYIEYKASHEIYTNYSVCWILPLLILSSLASKKLLSFLSKIFWICKLMKNNKKFYKSSHQHEQQQSKYRKHRGSLKFHNHHIVLRLNILNEPTRLLLRNSKITIVRSGKIEL